MKNIRLIDPLIQRLLSTTVTGWHAKPTGQYWGNTFCLQSTPWVCLLLSQHSFWVSWNPVYCFVQVWWSRMNGDFSFSNKNGDSDVSFGQWRTRCKANHCKLLHPMCWYHIPRLTWQGDEASSIRFQHSNVLFSWDHQDSPSLRISSYFCPCPCDPPL